MRGAFRASTVVAVAALTLASCGGPRSTALSVSSSASASPVVSGPGPCEVAASQRGRVAGLRAEGRLDRALRVLARAAELCPSSAADGAKDVAEVRAELGVDAPDAGFEETDDAKAPMRAAYREAAAKEAAGDLAGAKARYLEAWALWHPNGQALVQAGLAAARLGERAEAQRLFDRGIAEVERATGKQVALDAPNGWAPIQDVAWSPLGRVVVAHGKVVSILAQGTLAEVARLEAPGEVIWAVLSPDGAFVAVYANFALQLWDVQKARMLRSFDGGSGDLARGAFSPSGDRFVTGSRSALVWDVATGKRLAELDAGEGAFATSFAFSRDGGTVLASSSGAIHRWSIRASADGALSATPGAKIAIDGWIAHIAMSPDGKSLAWASDAKAVHLVDLATGREVRAFSGKPSGAAALQFSPDGRLLAFGSYDVVRVWSASSGDEILTLQHPGGGSVRVAFSPDGKTLVTGARAKALRLWDVSTGKELGRRAEHTDGIRSLAFSPRRDVLAAGSGERDVRLWSLGAASGQVLRAPLEASSRALAFGADGCTLAASVGKPIEALTLFDVDAGRAVRTFDRELKGVEAIAISPDGKVIAAYDASRRVARWDVASGSLIGELEGSGSTSSIAFSPDAAWLLAAGGNTLRTWDLTTGHLGQPFPEVLRGTFAAAWSPTGAPIVSSGWEGKLRLWDPTTHAETGTLDGHKAAVVSVAFSHDGRRLASGSFDDTVRVWDVDARKEIRRLDDHTGKVGVVAFSVDDALLATGSDDGSIHLYRGTDLQRVATLRSLAGREDGGYVFTPDSFIELVGAQGEEAAEYPLCRVGAVAFPFAVCRERFEVTGLLAKAIAGDASYRLP